MSQPSVNAAHPDRPPTAAAAALRRRDPGGALRPFDVHYLELKAQLIGPLVQRVARNGRLEDADLLSPAYAEIDERVPEYALVAAVIAHAPRSGRLQLLDVGCVLNNRVIEPVVRAHCDMVWLMNASIEKPALDLPLAYLVGDARTFPTSAHDGFDLVTCLSTLEHFGMDNTRYGGTPASFEGLIEDPERFACEGIACIARWVRPGGEILVSVPFGPFEFLYVAEAPGKPIYYTFDAPRLRKLQIALAAAGIESEVLVYKVVANVGWVRCDLLDPDIPRHADGCAAAGGVAFLRGRRPATPRAGAYEVAPPGLEPSSLGNPIPAP